MNRDNGQQNHHRASNAGHNKKSARLGAFECEACFIYTGCYCYLGVIRGLNLTHIGDSGEASQEAI